MLYPAPLHFPPVLWDCCRTLRTMLREGNRDWPCNNQFILTQAYPELILLVLSL
jgi:hypothetical protein